MIHGLGTLIVWGIILVGIYVAWTGFEKPRNTTTIVTGVVILAVGMGIRAHRNAIPTGLTSRQAIIKRALVRSKLAYEPAIAEQLGYADMADTDQVEVMENPKTHRYVFNYKFNGSVIPVYAVYSRVKDEQYNAYLIPVKDNKIYSLMTDDTVADKQINAKTYYGYSYEDLANEQPENAFNGEDHSDSTSSGNYVVTYQ